MITKYHNYDDGYIALANIRLKNTPDKLLINGNELYKKSEFHISIMAVVELAPLLDPEDIERASELLKQDFLDFVATNDMTQFTLTGEYRLVTRDDRMTLVAMVDLQGIEELFEYLRRKYYIDFPTQPTHITLYTLQPGAGIGILSREELENDSVSVEIPELQQLKIGT